MRAEGDLLCRACFEALPEVESPCCAPFGLPTAFETFVCEECKNVDFGFEGARTPLRYEGAGKQSVHALKDGGRLHEGRREGGSTLDARGTRWG